MSRNRIKIAEKAKLIPKPGERLAKLLDPKCYIVQEPYDSKKPEAGYRWRVHAGNGNKLSWHRNKLTAWKLSSIRIRNAIVRDRAIWLGIFDPTKKVSNDA